LQRSTGRWTGGSCRPVGRLGWHVPEVTG
jgi:hypothetical protein